MSLLPPNLACGLVEDTLPWNQATQFHIDSFLEDYTLHDSDWITLYVNCGWEDSAVAVIRFDPVWNQTVSTPTSRCADWPILFLRFTCVSSIKMTGFSDIGGLQRGISSVTVEHISDEEAVTKIADHYGSAVEVRHIALVDALVVDASKEVIKLPNPKAEQTDAANSRPSGTSVMSPADPASRAGDTPEASGNS